jgi:hypothetical protein
MNHVKPQLSSWMIETAYLQSGGTDSPEGLTIIPLNVTSVQLSTSGLNTPNEMPSIMLPLTGKASITLECTFLGTPVLIALVELYNRELERLSVLNQIGKTPSGQQTFK